MSKSRKNILSDSYFLKLADLFHMASYNSSPNPDNVGIVTSHFERNLFFDVIKANFAKKDMNIDEKYPASYAKVSILMALCSLQDDAYEHTIDGFSTHKYFPVDKVSPFNALYISKNKEEQEVALGIMSGFTKINHRWLTGIDFMTEDEIKNEPKLHRYSCVVVDNCEKNVVHHVSNLSNCIIYRLKDGD